MNTMPTTPKKKLEDYKKMCYNKSRGRVLATDGLWLVCGGFNRDHWEVVYGNTGQNPANFAKFTSSVIEQETEVILWQ